MTKQINKKILFSILIFISFVFICILTRGLRFFLVAYLTYRFGQKIGPFLDKQGTKWSIIIAAIIILIAAGIYFLFLK